MLKEGRTLHVDMHGAEEDGHPHWVKPEHGKPQSPPIVTHILQQGHLYFKKATPPSPSLAVHQLGTEHANTELVGAGLIETTAHVHRELPGAPLGFKGSELGVGCTFPSHPFHPKS